ncbi:MAG: phosphotransferase family protein, partial [Myxococcota bacterium]
VLGRVGAVLIEAWLDGDMLAPADAEAWTPAAGAVLGRLHARQLAAGVSTDEHTARWSEAAAADIALLQGAAALPDGTAEVVRSAVHRHDPGRARRALIHKDFCAENMLIDAQRRLRIIDTEQLAVEPAGFDLAWTWHRWPMSARAWEQFMAGYRSTAPPAPDVAHYWRIVTGLTLARVFFQRMPARLDAQLARLLDCVAGAERPAP